MFCDKRGQVFYFFVRFYLSILNQSTSTQPPSLVLMAGRVQNVPTFKTYPFAFHLEFFSELVEFLSVGAVAQLTFYHQVVSAFALADLFTRSSDFGTQVNFITFQRKGFVYGFLVYDRLSCILPEREPVRFRYFRARYLHSSYP